MGCFSINFITAWNVTNVLTLSIGMPFTFRAIRTGASNSLQTRLHNTFFSNIHCCNCSSLTTWHGHRGNDRRICCRCRGGTYLSCKILNGILLCIINNPNEIILTSVSRLIATDDGATVVALLIIHCFSWGSCFMCCTGCCVNVIVCETIGCA